MNSLIYFNIYKMKFNGLAANVKRLYFNYTFHYLKLLASTHIKTCFTLPKNAIMYSARQRAGENFLLDNKILYPFKYDIANSEDASTPINLAIRLENSFKELNIFKNEKDQNVSKLYKANFSAKIQESIDNDLKELIKYVKYIKSDEAKASLPAAVLAKLLYSIAQAERLYENEVVEDDLFNHIVSLFLGKLKYADAESLGNALLSLAIKQKFSSGIWTPLIAHIDKIKFEPEFTKVTNTSPHLFMYKETTTEAFKGLSPFGSKCYLEGYRSVFLTYSALRIAEKELPKSHKDLIKFNSRFPQMQEYINELETRQLSI